MTYILHRDLSGYPVPVSEGRGVYLQSRDGKRYLDGSCGAGITCLGFSNLAVKAAIQNQLETAPFAYAKGFTTEPLEGLGEHLVRNSPSGLDYAYFVSGGSEANEAAIMLARQFQVERGEEHRTLVLSRKCSYHGGTLMLTAIGDSPRAATYQPMLPHITHVGACHPFRFKNKDESDEAYVRRLGTELENAIDRADGAICAFIAETVVGGSLGAVAPLPGYFKTIREICDRNGIILILDEVMCGLGRTGQYFVFVTEGIVPDIVTVAKGLAAGYEPIGGVLLGKHIHAAIASGSGNFDHGHSFVGHATACAAALATQRQVASDDCLAQVRSRGVFLADALHRRLGSNSHVGDIRGRGLFMAVEFVQDRDSKAIFPPAAKIGSRIASAAKDRGLHLYGKNSNGGWGTGDFVLIAPPFIISESELDLLVDTLTDASLSVLN